MLERRHRTAAAICRKAGDSGSLEEKRQQLGMGEDARHQLAILEVVAGQRRLVLGEHTVDLRHALVGVVDRLTLPQQGLGDILQTERGEAPGRRAQRLDTVDDQPALGRGEEVITACAMLAPFHRRPGAPQAQRHLQALRMFMQYPQVELHQIPADDRVRVVFGEPGVQPFEQLASAFAVLQRKIDGRSIAVFRAEHIDLTLAAALQGNGIQIATGRGLDVQRDQPEPRTIVRRGFELHG